MRTQLDPARRQELIAATRQFFRDEMDEDFGDLKAGLIVDFFIGLVGPPVYNKAIRDAHGFLQDKLSDLADAYYEPEAD